MKIIIPGGSGQVGALLTRAFVKEGHEVVVLSRSGDSRPGQAHRVVAWDARTMGDWAAELEGADVVINLAGRSVNCRYTPANREVITRSRVDSTLIIGEAISKAAQPPRVWLQSSTATIYCHRYDAPNDDVTGILGGDEPSAPDTWKFSIHVAKSWEEAALARALPPRTRQVLLRSAVVVSPDRHGIFDTLLMLVRRGLGGTAGHGRQFVSWIHEHDFIRAIQFLIDTPSLSGPVALAAPHPLPNAQFMRELRRAWGMPIGLPAMQWMLELGAIFMRTETELILKSRRVVGTRLMQQGFQFEYTEWPAAARELCDRWRAWNNTMVR